MRISNDDDLQSELVLVLRTSLSDRQLACLRDVQLQPPYPLVMFEDPALMRRVAAMDQARGRAAARDWLEARGMLDGLPVFDKSRDKPVDYARRVERFCGLVPGSVLAMHPSGMLTVDPRWLDRLRQGSLAREDEKFTCLMNVIAAADGGEHGLRFGFVGNEALAIRE